MNQKNKQIMREKKKACPLDCFDTRSISGRHCYAKHCRRAFTLVELLVAMFVFSVIMVAVTGLFATSTDSYRKARATQRNLEDAQFALNLMMKSLRMSSVVDDTVSSVKIFDYSQNKCIQYGLNSNKLQSAVSNASPLATDDPKTWCLDYGFSGVGEGWTDLTTGFVTGNFSVISSASNIVGRVTVSLQICAPDAAGTDCSTGEQDKVRIQSTVSLRDYEEVGL